METMFIRYHDAAGKEHRLAMGKNPIVIGRDSKADIVLDDERVTRAHCEIRSWAGDYIIKDLQSKNGTFVNDERVEVARLQLHDVIKIGAFLLHIQDERSLRLGETQAGEILKEMNHGKGFNTILHQIVDDLPEDDETS